MGVGDIAAFGATAPVRGGAAQGGAALRPLGAEVLGRYRQMQAATREAIAADVVVLTGLMTDISQKK